MKLIYVDGYNVINSWPNLNMIKEHNFEGSREKLVEILQNYASYGGDRVVLVFDAHLVKGSLEKKERLGNITVVYTKMGETADSYIERHVNKVGRKYDVMVVTSDLLEQQLVFQRGAMRISAMEFYQEVSRICKKISNKISSSAVSSRNLIEDRIDRKVFEKLDSIRKQDD